MEKGMTKIKIVKKCFQLKYILSTTKTKYKNSNHSPFTNNNISKTIMTCSRLRNIFLKRSSTEVKAASINKETIAFLSSVKLNGLLLNLDHKKIADNKFFGNIILEKT